MSVPGIVQSSLGDEHVAATVPLGGEDALYVTPTRTLIYCADGLLSDESVEEYPHDTERIEVSEGRRKSTISLDYGIDGTDQFKVPTKRPHDALYPVIADVLNAAGVTDSNEQVIQTYQFSELTLVLTSARVVKHVGEAIWDEDFEQFHYGDVTRLDVEEGNVSSQIIIEVDGRPQRIKTPSDQTREVRERIEQARLSYHDVESYAEFEQTVTPDEEGEPEVDENVSLTEDDVFGGAVDPLDANPPELAEDRSVIEEPPAAPLDDSDPVSEPTTADADDETAGTGSSAAEAEESGMGEPEPSDSEIPDSETEDSEKRDSVAPDSASSEPTGPAGFADSGFESASENLDDPTDAQLAALTEAVERQNELLERQQHTIERLVEKLTRAR